MQNLPYPFITYPCIDVQDQIQYSDVCIHAYSHYVSCAISTCRFRVPRETQGNTTSLAKDNLLFVDSLGLRQSPYVINPLHTKGSRIQQGGCCFTRPYPKIDRRHGSTWPTRSRNRRGQADEDLVKMAGRYLLGGRPMRFGGVLVRFSKMSHAAWGVLWAGGFKHPGPHGSGDAFCVARGEEKGGSTTLTAS
jgi:hypothetical protein